ncbi:hydrogenase maturation protease [Elusimicrobiota bacterium]
MRGPRRIICVGNRHASEDDTGPRVHDLLSAGPLPEGVELVDGGLAGLDLLRWIEGADRVVFVDRVKDLGRPGELIVLDADGLARLEAPDYGHADGLAYLVKAATAVCGDRTPELALVGVEGEADERTLRAAADASLRLAGRSRSGADDDA